MSSFKVVLGFVASMNLEIEQFDMKIAFLYGELEEEIYLEQPEGFKERTKTILCVDWKWVYKDSSRHLDSGIRNLIPLIKHDYDKTTFDHCVFIKQFSNGDFIVLLQNVDDMLSKLFAMKEFMPIKQILGMKTSHDRKNAKLWLSQESYVKKLLDRFNMGKAKIVSSPLASYLNVSSKQSLTSERKKENMQNGLMHQLWVA